MPPISTDDPATCLYVCLSHSCTLLRPLDGIRCRSAGRLVWLSYTGAPVTPVTARDLGIGLEIETPVKICIANCSQTVTASGIVAIDSLQELSNALSNGTIADPMRLPLPLITRLQ